MTSIWAPNITERAPFRKTNKSERTFEIEMIQSIASFYNSSELSISAMRFSFVLLVEHCGMLRTDELLSMRYKDIEFFEDRMVIFGRNKTTIGIGKVALVILEDKLSLYVQFHLQRSF